jgi:ribosomal protein S18 acetylase RimI-like enzyme
MRLRQATIDDAYEIAYVGYLAWRWAYGSFLTPEFIEERCNLERRIERTHKFLQEPGLVLVAVNDSDSVLGFASEHVDVACEGFEAEIGGLYVRPDAARLGAGRALVVAMVEDFKRRGLRSMAIHTLIQNEIGCNFYKKIGGRAHTETTWHGYPSIWFVWDDFSAFNVLKLGQ